jgi:hypothetical protein
MNRFLSLILTVISLASLPLLFICIIGTLSPASADRLDKLRTILEGDDVEATWQAVHTIPRGLSSPEKDETIHLLRKALMREWPRCTGDIRQAIAQKMADLDAKAAIPDLLELIREDRRISHECAE